MYFAVMAAQCPSYQLTEDEGTSLGATIRFRDGPFDIRGGGWAGIFSSGHVIFFSCFVQQVIFQRKTKTTII